MIAGPLYMASFWPICPHRQQSRPKCVWYKGTQSAVTLQQIDCHLNATQPNRNCSNWYYLKKPTFGIAYLKTNILKSTFNCRQVLHLSWCIMRKQILAGMFSVDRICLVALILVVATIQVTCANNFASNKVQHVKGYYGLLKDLSK